MFSRYALFLVGIWLFQVVPSIKAQDQLSSPNYDDLDDPIYDDLSGDEDAASVSLHHHLDSQLVTDQDAAPISLRHHHENQLTGTVFGLPPWYMMTSYSVETGPVFQIDQTERARLEQQETLERAAAERAASQSNAAALAAAQPLSDYDAWG